MYTWVQVPREDQKRASDCLAQKWWMLVGCWKWVWGSEPGFSARALSWSTKSHQSTLRMALQNTTWVQIKRGTSFPTRLTSANLTSRFLNFFRYSLGFFWFCLFALSLFLILCVCVWVYAHDYRYQEKPAGIASPGPEAVMSCSVWVLGTELWSFRVSNHCAIPPAPIFRCVLNSLHIKSKF